MAAEPLDPAGLRLVRPLTGEGAFEQLLIGHIIGLRQAMSTIIAELQRVNDRLDTQALETRSLTEHALEAARNAQRAEQRAERVAARVIRKLGEEDEEPTEPSLPSTRRPR